MCFSLIRRDCRFDAYALPFRCRIFFFSLIRVADAAADATAADSFSFALFAARYTRAFAATPCRDGRRYAIKIRQQNIILPPPITLRYDMPARRFFSA